MGSNGSLIAWKRLLAGTAGFVLSLAIFWLGWKFQFPQVAPSTIVWIISGFESIVAGVLVAALFGLYHHQRHRRPD